MDLSKINDYGRLVMFSHSIFSLPFGLLAMFFAYGGVPSVKIFALVLLALFAARNGANAFNRIADKDIDKKNPRTSGRHLPTGKVKPWEAWIITIFCFVVFGIAAAMLNIVCLALAPVAVGLFIFYSYSKRLTWLCHYILGFCCGGAPVGAWLAAGGDISLTPFVMAAAVCFWIAGFDIIYATQDIDFDRKEKIHSVPARFGFKNALNISSASHALAVIFLLALAFLVDELGVIYNVGIFLIACLLVIEHRNVSPKNTKKMLFASYGVNQIISVVFFVFTCTDYFL